LRSEAIVAEQIGHKLGKAGGDFLDKEAFLAW
jgi:hypothetical protein